ncbi:MAG: alpha/beta hydrolase, partial [Actinomycetota bacterium]
GIFDLEPITRTSVNDAVRLTPETARALSPIYRLELAADTPMTVIWGENETNEFKRQSREYVDKWSTVKSHMPAIGREIPSRNHFDILHEVPTQRLVELAGA